MQTGLPTKDYTLGTTVQNLLSLNIILTLIFSWTVNIFQSSIFVTIPEFILYNKSIFWKKNLIRS